MKLADMPPVRVSSLDDVRDLIEAWADYQVPEYYTRMLEGIEQYAALKKESHENR